MNLNSHIALTPPPKWTPNIAGQLHTIASDIGLALERIELKQAVLDKKIFQLKLKIARFTHTMDDKTLKYFELKVVKLIEEHDLPSNPYPDIMEMLSEAWSLGRVSATDEALAALRGIKGRP